VSGVGVPLQVVDAAAVFQVKEADRSLLAKVEVTINVEEENLAIAGSGDEGHLVGRVFNVVDWAVVGLNAHGELNVRVAKLKDTHDTGFETDSDHSTLVLFRATHNVNAVSFASKLVGVVSLSAGVVPNLDHTVLTASNCHVVGVRHCEVSDLTGVVLEEDLSGEVVGGHFPESTLHVVNQPDAVTAHNIQDVAVVTLFGEDLDFLERLNSDLKNFIGFSSVNLSKGPPLDETVGAAGNNGIVLEQNSLNTTRVQLGLKLTIENQMSLDKVAFPKHHGTVFSS